MGTHIRTVRIALIAGAVLGAALAPTAGADADCPITMTYEVMTEATEHCPALGLQAFHVCGAAASFHSNCVGPLEDPNPGYGCWWCSEPTPPDPGACSCEDEGGDSEENDCV